MTNPLLTHETRWFIPGNIPPEVLDWYWSLGDPNSQESRTDRYLRRVDASLGIKVREGNIEVKQRNTEYGFHPFSPAVSGRVESWAKWSFEIAAAVGLSTDPARWLPVAKTRQIIYFSYSTQGDVSLTGPGHIPSQGGSVELTQVQALEEIWWTLGVEVIGHQKSQFDILTSLLQHIFEHTPPPYLQPQASFSYPHWLAQFIQKGT